MDELNSVTVFTELVRPSVSLPVGFFILMVLLPGAALFGHTTGRKRWLAANEEKRTVLGYAGETTLGAILGLLGLLVAFSFGNALSAAGTRQATVVAEANAIGTAFLRADLLPEPGRTALKQALFEYGETRIITVNIVQSSDGVKRFLRQTLDAQDKLWPTMLDAVADPVAPPVKTFVAGAINDVIDAHSDRLATAYVPAAEMTSAMVLAAALTALFLVGNRAGLQGRPLTWRTFLLAGFLVVVLATVSDLQRPVEGVIHTNYEILEAAILEMRIALEGSG